MQDITLDELFACLSGGEIIVAQSMDSDAFVHIDDAGQGLACNCVCPGCGGALIARKGQERKHTFAHYVDYSELCCRRSGETALHKFAKDLLNRERRLNLPPVNVSDDLGSIRVADGKVLEFDEVILEKRMDGFVPDVIARKGGHELHVEFFVTHPCGDEKIAKLKASGVSALEIDLSRFRDCKLRDLGAVILAKADRRWLHSRLSATGERMLADRRETAEKEIAAKAGRVADAFALLPVLEAPIVGDWELKALSHDLGFLVASEPRLRSCYAVREEEWKGFALLRYGYRLHRGFSQKDLLRDLIRHEWVLKPFDDATPAVAERVRQMGWPDFRSPQEDLERFLREMERLRYFVISESGKVTGQKPLLWLVEGSSGEFSNSPRRERSGQDAADPASGGRRQ